MNPQCRFCGSVLDRTFVDLGIMPLANAYPLNEDHARHEKRFPLHARVCEQCLLVQVDSVVSREELFVDYAYFSSYSSSWVEHARQFAANCVKRLALGPESLVMEVASNDGYLLRHFVDAGVPVLGIDPAANVAAKAIRSGVNTHIGFFGKQTATALSAEGHRADLLVANNVFAHVPDLNDFAAGLATSLKSDGVLSIEVPHLLNLIERVEFDTIYHEHFSYFSLLSAERVLDAHGLTIFDVEELATHGGSLRIWGVHQDQNRPASARLLALRDREQAAGLHRPEGYVGFEAKVQRCRDSLVQFLADASSRDVRVVAYGAAAKGNTLLNYCGLGPDEIAYVVDRNTYKQGRLLPGSHLEIHDPARVAVDRPDYLLILAWNLQEEIAEQMGHLRDWGGRFVVAVPETHVLA